MQPHLKALTLALALFAAPTSAAAQGTSATQNDAITTQTESDGTPGNEVQGTGTTDAAGTTDTAGTTTDTATGTSATQNDAVTTPSESDGVRGNERQGTSFPWGLLGLLGLLGLTGRRAAPEMVSGTRRNEVKLGGPTDGPRPS